MQRNQPTQPINPGRRRWGRAQIKMINDPYKASEKPHEPAICPQCGALFQEGRWQWRWPSAPAYREARLCQACHRTNDHFPAGILTLKGSFVPAHREEILQLARHQEAVENGEHPMNRIIDVEEGPDSIVINTTDIHLPHRIGTSCKRAFRGTLALHYDEDGYFLRADWRRDD